MKVLVIGSGAREHAFLWRLSQSRHKPELFCAPGNAGTSRLATNVEIPTGDVNKLLAFALEMKIDFTLVGPENWLTLGVCDLFEENGLKIFGPTKSASRLEGSKKFAKEVMQAAGIPTANYRTFTDLSQATEFALGKGAPLVLKCDGLAAGKGVIVCKESSEIEPGLKTLFTSYPGNEILVEDFVSGIEASFIVATDGSRIFPFSSAHDYKRIFDGDKGPNTGGMGTVSPSKRVTAEMEKLVMRSVIEPCLGEMRKRNDNFRGFLYAGLMISPNGEINVLEFNARMGDPECQVLMRRMRTDLLDLLLSLCDNQSLPTANWEEGSAVCVTLAAHGYPEKVRTGDEIVGLELATQMPGIQVFHAGTAVNPKFKLVTSGGRVLSVTSLANSLSDSRDLAYKAADIIQFSGVQKRRDIGS